MEKKEFCYERIKQALKIRGLRQSDLVKITGIGKSAISQYISGKYIPKQTATYKIAKALNVSEAWLMGYNVPIQRVEEIKSVINQEEKNLLNLFNKLDTVDKRETLDFIQYKLSKDKYKIKKDVIDE